MLITAEEGRQIAMGVMEGSDDQAQVLEFLDGNPGLCGSFVSSLAHSLMAAKCIARDEDFLAECRPMMDVAACHKPMRILADMMIRADRKEDDELKGCIAPAVLEERYNWLLGSLVRGE